MGGLIGYLKLTRDAAVVKVAKIYSLTMSMLSALLFLVKGPTNLCVVTSLRSSNAQAFCFCLLKKRGEQFLRGASTKMGEFMV